MNRIEKLKELCEKATEGPWIVQGATYVTLNSLILAHCKEYGSTTFEECKSNANIITSSRNALPDLLALVDTMREAIVEAHRDMYDWPTGSAALAAYDKFNEVEE